MKWQLAWLLGVCLFGCTECNDADEHKPILLYPEGQIPLDEGRNVKLPGYDEAYQWDVKSRFNVTLPMLLPHMLPADERRSSNASAIVIPGGGYEYLSFANEGTDVAQWLRSVGVSGFVLQHRVPASRYPHEGFGVVALMDAQRAFSLLRHMAPSLGLDPNRIGIVGFSAGGHLAVRLANEERRSYTSIDEVDEVSSRPDWIAVNYPAFLSRQSLGVKWNPPGNLPNINFAVSKNHPPALVMGAWGDALIVPESYVSYVLHLRRVNVPVDLVIYSGGEHGYGLCPTLSLDKDTDTVGYRDECSWPVRLQLWLMGKGFLQPPKLPEPAFADFGHVGFDAAGDGQRLLWLGILIGFCVALVCFVVLATFMYRRVRQPGYVSHAVD
eukprot:TRINITY_DN55647_c0_g1_i1.p1 TRINITY_DN55647_c0_g1~~TRINITY_DN55647_c0_g1_i1.p1  ORF type:complete len:383 (+),score=18.08 TRINITY_DN55647_c0_g1_i1:147-1295(+)